MQSPYTDLIMVAKGRQQIMYEKTVLVHCCSCYGCIKAFGVTDIVANKEDLYFHYPRLCNLHTLIA